MVQFCTQIAAAPETNQRYQNRVGLIAKWYRGNHAKYAARLKAEATLDTELLKTLEEGSEDIITALGIQDLDYTFDAKLAYFVVSDTLIKLILSKYSLGPTSEFMNKYQVFLDSYYCTDTWLKCPANSVTMTEIVARVLDVEMEEHHFDLMSLQVERSGRNEIAHSGAYSRCMSAIRCYNTIRGMLVFLDSQYKDLPVFEYTHQFDMNHFLASPCDFDFECYTSILIAESVHDVPEHQRSAIANLPWDMVIDLDGYSQSGGLLSAVTHNRIRKQTLDLNAAAHAQRLVRGNTLWYQCGNYQDCLVKFDGRKFSVNGHTAFRTGRSAPVEDVLACLLARAKDVDRPLNIVVLDDRSDFVKALTNILLSRDYDDTHFFITWIGLDDQDRISIRNNLFGRDEDLMDEVFRHFQAPVAHFFEAVADRPTLWKPRESMDTNFFLQGVDGPVFIPENIRNNLEPYFDVLYDGCENVSEEVAQEETDAFLRGHTASWSVIARGAAVPLKTPEEMRGITDHIRTILGQTQSDPGKRFVFIKHTSGIGGTTLARQIAWEMHTLKYPVLSVKNYDSSRVPAILEDLYDNILETKPMVLLVEDTLRDRDRFFDYIKRINRRCVVLCAFREKTPIRVRNSKHFYLTVLSENQVEQVRQCYRTARQIQNQMIDWELERHISAELTDQKMRTPFIIGLYYMEQDFRIKEYVHKAIESCTLDQREVLAFLALCDKYYHKYVPVSFVNHALNIPTKNLFLKQVPAADSLVCRGTNDGIDVYYFKHLLLSEYYLDEYSNGAYTTMLSRLAKKMIDVVANVSTPNRHQLELLIWVLIQNRTYYEGFSQLMMDISDQAAQRTIMQQMVDSFVPFADAAVARIRGISGRPSKNNDSETDLAVAKLVSHAYAHLGRMYSRHTIHSYSQAAEFFRKSLDYLMDDNSNIYHMYGTGILDKLRSEWEHYPEDTKPSVDERADYRAQIDEAVKYFDLACLHGSPDYGYPSKLEIYYRYMKFMYQVFHVRNDEDLRLIPPEDRLIQGDFLRTLEEAQNLAHFDNFSKEATDKIDSYDGSFQSNILFGDYGQAVVFYENQVQKYRQQNDLDHLRPALRNLFFTRINKIRKELPENDFPYGIKKADAEKLFSNVDQLIDQIDGKPETYTEYRSISTLFRYWFQFAKLTDKPVDLGLSNANRWVDMEQTFNETSRRQSAEPFYHQMTMKLLSLLDNPLAQNEMSNIKDLQARLSRMDSSSNGPRYKLRDILVNGTGMGRLRDVSRQSSQDNVMGFLKYAMHELKLTNPVPVDGRIIDVSSRATLELYSPNQWSTLKVSLHIGKEAKNTFSSNQINHQVRFLIGFGFDGLSALSATARDLSNERFDLNQILPKDAGFRREVQMRKEPWRRYNANRITMTPGKGVQNLRMDKDGHITALFGTYIPDGEEDPSPIVLEASDLERFSAPILAPYGSLDDIFLSLQKQESFPCVPIRTEEPADEGMRVSVYDTRSPLYALLGQSAPAETAPVVTAAPAPTTAPVAQTPAPAESAPAAEPEAPAAAAPVVPPMTVVELTITNAASKAPTGRFTYQGTEFQARVQGKITSKQRNVYQKAQNSGRALSATIMGTPGKDGVYSVKTK